MRRLARLIPCALAGLLCGCEAMTADPAPASSFTAAAPENPLNGAVINAAGNESAWTVEDGTLKQVVISGTDSGKIIFGESTDGAVVPREIAIDGDSSVLSIDRDADQVTIEAEAPFGIGPVSFTGPLPSELVVSRELFLPSARTKSGTTALDAPTCDRIVGGVEAFCTNYFANGDAAEREITDFAIELAETELGSTAANGFISSTISEYFDLLDVFCDGFEQVNTVEAVDMCAALR